jgi:WD40 repeat protein
MNSLNKSWTVSLCSLTFWFLTRAIAIGDDGESVTVIKTLKGSAECVAFCTDNKTVVCGDIKGNIYVWALDSDQPKATLTFDGEHVNRLKLSPKGDLLAVSTSLIPVPNKPLKGVLRMVNMADHKVLWEIPTAGGDVALAFSPDGKTLATRNNENFDNTIKLWQPGTGKELVCLPGAGREAISLSFSPDGKNLAVGGADGYVRVWDLAEERILREFRAFPKSKHLGAVAYRPDGKALAIGGGAGEMVECDPKTGDVLQTMEGGCLNADTLTYSPNGKLLAFSNYRKDKPGGHCQLVLFDTTAGKRYRVLKGHEDTINTLAFSPNGKLIATASSDKTIRIYKLLEDD